MRNIIVLMIFSVTMICSCDPTTGMLSVSTDRLPAGIESTVATILVAARGQDAVTVLELSQFADGRARTVEEIAYALERHHSFWNYDVWELKSAATSISSQKWKVTVELAYSDGRTLPVDIWLAARDGGWVVTDVPIPAVLFARD